jgi:hypothetical protein
MAAFGPCSSRKFHPHGLGNVKRNRRILCHDAYPASPARCFDFRPAQVAAPAEAENLYLRHQLNIAMRKAPGRLWLRGADRALMIWMTRLWPDLLSLSRVVRPDTILRWHRAGFRAYWRWKSRGQPGRPRISRELRELIQRMSRENRLWGAPRIHGELLKLGFEVAESTVSKYMIRHRGPRGQDWRTFLRNHGTRSLRSTCSWFPR